MNKLGPCPLCGGEADGYARVALCSQPNCPAQWWDIGHDDWNRLSALAARERRMREALERCRELAKNLEVLQLGETDADDTVAAYQIDVACQEALKGGEG